MASVVLNTNPASLRIQRRLGEATTSLQKSFEKLSSGLRINRASDDAAGLSIASLLNTDSRVFAQGVRNVNDGISMLNIAEGSLRELSAIAQRQLELAQQSANGTLTRAQRMALNAELRALTAEYNRIVKATDLNGKALLDVESLNSASATQIQAGYGSSGSIGFSLGERFGRSVGDGSLTFDSSKLIGSRADESFTGDFNNDGHQDIIVSDAGASRVDVLLGNGDGTFKATISSAAGTNDYHIAIGDFNNDGKLDVVSAVTNGTQAAILIGRGDGSFDSPAYYTVGNGSWDPQSADFNNDGYDDIVVANVNSNDVSVCLANSDGTFRAQTRYQIGDFQQWHQIALGDFNGDDQPDIISADYGESTLSILLGRHDGTFADRSVLNASTMIGTGATAPVVGDFNNDGFDDLYLNVFGGGLGHFFAGNGDGTFRKVSTIDLSAGGGGQALFVDLNGDGNLDLFKGPHSTNSASIHLGDGTGSFSRTSVINATSNWSAQLSSADFNEDGAPDVVIPFDSTGFADVFMGTPRRVSTVMEVSLLTQQRARSALPTLKDRLSRIAAELGSIGATQSRFGTALSNLSVSRENCDAAASQITDMDIATESAQLLKSQILQQASGAILAQANHAPALALQLLRF